MTAAGEAEAKIAQLKTENDALHEALLIANRMQRAAEDRAKAAECAVEPMLRSLDIGEGGMSAEVAGPIVQRLAMAMACHFRASGAANYIEMGLNAKDPPFERYTVTVQWYGAKSPHMLRAEAETQRDRLAAELDTARAEVEAKDGRIAELEAELVLLDEVCGHYALDEVRFLRDEGEPYGSVPIEAGMMAHQAGRRYAEREMAELAERTRVARAALGDPTAPEDDRYDAQFEIKMVGYAEARLAPLLAARTAGGHHGA